ncbi:MAG: alpha/beta hydrolase [Ardenticatenales bacterium]|nr:alpha/beta hydrolase [Ardenticatenales bacterium]
MTLTLAYGADPFQFGELRLPAGAGPHPVVIVIHGGFWRARYDLTHIRPLCEALTAAGVATWSIEYRRIGNPGGGWPGTLLDVAQAASHLRTLALDYPLDLARVVAMGHSAGGHLALWLAGAARVPAGDPLHVVEPLPIHAAISLAGVADLRRAWELRLSNNVVEDFLGGAPAQVPERYDSSSPIELLPLGAKQVLIHGVEDDIVPIEISRRYHEAATRLGDEVALHELPRLGHFEPIEPGSAAWPAVRDAVLGLVGG